MHQAVEAPEWPIQLDAVAVGMSSRGEQDMAKVRFAWLEVRAQIDVAEAASRRGVTRATCTIRTL
jgi:hypothetical protein